MSKSADMMKHKVIHRNTKLKFLLAIHPLITAQAWNWINQSADFKIHLSNLKQGSRGKFCRIASGICIILQYLTVCLNCSITVFFFYFNYMLEGLQRGRHCNIVRNLAAHQLFVLFITRSKVCYSGEAFSFRLVQHYQFWIRLYRYRV